MRCRELSGLWMDDSAAAQNGVDNVLLAVTSLSSYVALCREVYGIATYIAYSTNDGKLGRKYCFRR